MRPLLVALLLVPLAVQAQAPESLFNLVTLNAQAEKDVPNDLLTAILAAESEGMDTAKLAEATNRVMQAALEVARGYRNVQARSGNYQTFPRYESQSQKIVAWRARQELRLESADFAAITDLIGKLQSSLIVSSISLSVSADARRRTENALIAEALALFDERARIVQNARKESGFRIRSLQISGGGPVYPQPYSVARPAAASPLAVTAPAPVIEPGTSRVLITVSGTIQLQ